MYKSMYFNTFPIHFKVVQYVPGAIMATGSSEGTILDTNMKSMSH